MTIRDYLAIGFLILGFLFMLASAIGVIRLPDFFSRLHSSGIGETLGLVLSGMGLIIYKGIAFTSLKIFFIVLAIFIVNPVGTYLIGKAALHSGEQKVEEDENANISA